MVRKITAGASLGVKLPIPNIKYGNVSPSFWLGIEEGYEEDELSEDQLEERCNEILDECRKIVEERVDEDIEDVYEVKVFKQIEGGKNV